MMKQRSDHLIELAMKENDIPNKNKSSITPRRRTTIHEVPSPQAFETVTTTTRTSKRSKRAKSLFLGSQYDNDSEKLAEPLVDSLDKCYTSMELQGNKSVCEDRDDSHVVLTSSVSPLHYKHISLQSQEPSNYNLNDEIEPQPSNSRHSPFLYSPPASESLSFLRSSVKTRGGISRNLGIKVLQCQRVEIRHSKIALNNVKENSKDNVEAKSQENLHTEKDESLQDLYIMDEISNVKENSKDYVEPKSQENLDTENFGESLKDLDIMNEMKNIFKGEDQQDKQEAKLLSKKKLTEEDLIKMLELDDASLEERSDQENVSDDCLLSDESEDENINNNEALQSTDEEWMSERDPNIVPFEFDGYEKKLKVLPETNKPYEYFSLIATDEFFTMLVEKANSYASKLLSNILDPKSRFRLWKPITVPEMKTFFGILFHMGTIKLNRVTDYWKKHPLFNLTAFSKHMSRNRFLLIMRSLNFEDDLSDNRLSKINDLINYLTRE